MVIGGDGVKPAVGFFVQPVEDIRDPADSSNVVVPERDHREQVFSPIDRLPRMRAPVDEVPDTEELVARLVQRECAKCALSVRKHPWMSPMTQSLRVRITAGPTKKQGLEVGHDL